MTREEMYRELAVLQRITDWNDRESIHRYNERAQELRHQVSDEEERLTGLKVRGRIAAGGDANAKGKDR